MPRTAAAKQARRRRLRKAVILTFPVAFCLHDLEEVLVADRWGRHAPHMIRRRWPSVPDWMVAMSSTSTPEMAIAVGVVSAGVATGTASGWKHIDGDLGFLPALLSAFTGHGATHLLQAVALRHYTPGAATVPLVIAPYSWWAWRTLRRAGLSRSPAAAGRDAAQGAALALALATAGHGAAAVLRRPNHANQ